MLFNSFEFLALLAGTFVLYYAPGLSRIQIALLIAASLIFYGSFQPMLLLLLLLTLSINIIASHLVMAGSPGRRRTYAALGVIFNLGVLVFFKYGALIVNTLPFTTGSVGAFIVTLPLPLGISFFTFHGITLLVDTFREHRGRDAPAAGKSRITRHAAKVGIYFLFFPQLVAGPITKSRFFLPQIRTKRLHDVHWEYAFRNLVLGYFLKMVIADNLAQQTFWITYPYFIGRSATDLLTMLFGYSMQIFADFAGYSLIAIGIAALFGYYLPQNFNAPYLSQSFSEFWTRWHMSLSSFLKEYLYIPLGGNRGGKLRTYLNLFAVMLLGGLWHGAAWSYLTWGGAHGAALATERMFADRIRWPDHVVLKAVKTLIVFVYVTLAWLLFKLTDFSHVIEYIRTICANWNGGVDRDILLYTAAYSIPVVGYHLIRRFRDHLPAFRRIYLEAPLFGLMLFFILTNSGEPQSFVYFQF